MEIVRLSFRFGKAMAAIQPPQTAPGAPDPTPEPPPKDLPYLLSADRKLRASAHQRAGEEQLYGMLACPEVPEVGAERVGVKLPQV